MKKGAIILCGGHSRRMGRDKASLPFGPESMLQRMIRLIGEVIPNENIVVVASPGQVLPEIPSGVSIAYDAHQNRGPLEGFAAGLQLLANRAEAVYLTSCDAPLLRAGFVEFMFRLLGEDQAVVPDLGQYQYPLNAVYRSSVLQPIRRMLEIDRLSVRELLEEIHVRKVTAEELREVDSQLDSLRNLNCQEDYLAALGSAGFKSQSYRW